MKKKARTRSPRRGPWCEGQWKRATEREACWVPLLFGVRETKWARIAGGVLVRSTQEREDSCLWGPVVSFFWNSKGRVRLFMIKAVSGPRNELSLAIKESYKCSPLTKKAENTCQNAQRRIIILES